MDVFFQGLQIFSCERCGEVNERALIIDPAIRWWVDEADANEYWHETACVFLYNSAGEFLFFDRIKSPFGLTVPAGHVDAEEHPGFAAMRELREETDVRVTHVFHLLTHDIAGDKCRRGADVHRWHVYATKMPASAVVSLGNEGIQPTWLTLEQAWQRNLTFAVRYLITNFAATLQQAIT